MYRVRMHMQVDCNLPGLERKIERWEIRLDIQDDLGRFSSARRIGFAALQRYYLWRCRG